MLRKPGIPSPFAIAVILTLITYILALIFTHAPENNTAVYPLQVLGYWEKGFWELLQFTMQMALILILGHALALTPFFNKLIAGFARYCHTTANAAFTISLLTIMVSFINWGLCLIFGAIFARKVAEHAKKQGIPLNYPLIGASGYSGMMCWHGGFSGSAPLKVAEADHFLSEKIGQMGIEQTILSPLNITTSVLLVIIIPLVFYWLGKKSAGSPVSITFSVNQNEVEDQTTVKKADPSKIASVLMGVVILFIAIRKLFLSEAGSSLSFINLNYINFSLFGLGLLLHASFGKFLSAIQTAVGGAAGIIIQFPLYAGIMGIMKYSGLGVVFSEAFVHLSNATTFPLFTFISAGVVNIFVPSGGGQWIVQGPIVINAAQTLDVPVNKAIMALAYGDQLTNMLQPFWALPLLGITRLKAKDILPYSTLIMLIGALIFISVLFIF